MRKSLIIALAALVASIVVAPAAHADSPLGRLIIAQEKATRVVVQPTPPTAIDQILAQERGRHANAGLYGPYGRYGTAPVLVAGPSDAFDVRDAGIGAAAALALALLVAAGVALRGSRRRTTAAATAES